jgi:NodT family efflux transporter outer membrane factor (OMF) lipoprotein
MKPILPLPILVVLLAASCAAGPDYRRPEAPVSPSYKEASPRPGSSVGRAVAPQEPISPGAAAPQGEKSDWKTSEPGDEEPRGSWWEVFGDATLNELEGRVTVSNPTLAKAEAQVRGAQAAVRATRSQFFPAAGVDLPATRSSGLSRSASSSNRGAPPTVNAYQAPLTFSWELDLFGRIRRTLEASKASAQASAADLESVRLAMHAEMAVDYFTLRGLDTQKKLVDDTIAAYERALALTRNRYAQGIVSGTDVAQAQTQLEAARAQATDLALERSQVEHAIAILAGEPPAQFTLVPEVWNAAPPVVPAGLPSELLERRPDIAAAERRTAQANAQIGIARAAYFPSLTLSGSGGYAGPSTAALFTLPNRFWALGAALAETVFDAGKRRALSDQAVAGYDAAVAAYRETVLSGFQEVEDGLAAQRLLAEEAHQQKAAASSAERLVALANNRYKAGVTTYLEVVTAQSAALTIRRAAVALETRRFVACVNLIKALGGSWDAADLPSTDPPARMEPPPGPPAAEPEVK